MRYNGAFSGHFRGERTTLFLEGPKGTFSMLLQQTENTPYEFITGTFQLRQDTAWLQSDFYTHGVFVWGLHNPQIKKGQIKLLFQLCHSMNTPSITFSLGSISAEKITQWKEAGKLHKGDNSWSIRAPQEDTLFIAHGSDRLYLYSFPLKQDKQILNEFTIIQVPKHKNRMLINMPVYIPSRNPNQLLLGRETKTRFMRIDESPWGVLPPLEENCPYLGPPFQRILPTSVSDLSFVLRK